MKLNLVFLCILTVLAQNVRAQQAKFDKPYYLKVGSSFDYVAIGDVNGDGLNDVAGATTFYFDPANDHQIFLWLQSANGQLQTPLQFPYAAGSAGCLAVADLYNNGTSEVLIGVGGTLYIYGWANNTLKMQDSFITITNYAEDAVTTGDFDGDGLTDIGISHWGGDRITVLFQNGEAGAKWDVRHYNVPTNGLGHVTAGKFGPLQQNALIYVNGQGAVPLTVMTFDATRNLQNKYDMTAPGITFIHSAAVVKRSTGINELWFTYGGNSPYSMISIWRGLQNQPDSTFHTYDIPEAIQSANLDCDADDEPVVIHGGWDRVTVYADDTDNYNVFTPSHYKQDGLALGDINNDGRKDICAANGIGSKVLMILYNITSPCWLANVQNSRIALQGLSLYPNPATDIVTIESAGKGDLQISDAQGRLMYSASFDHKAIINTAQWATGLYFATLLDEHGERLTEKLLKN